MFCAGVKETTTARKERCATQDTYKAFSLHVEEPNKPGGMCCNYCQLRNKKSGHVFHRLVNSEKLSTSALKVATLTSSAGYLVPQSPPGHVIPTKLGQMQAISRIILGRAGCILPACIVKCPVQFKVRGMSS